MGKGFSLTDVLAIYGAVLSSLAVAWNVYRAITNRGRLHVRVSLADIGAAGLGRIATNRLWYKVTNVGRQPIWLTQIGGGLRDGKEFLLTVPKQFPIKLEPGETFDDSSADAAQLDGERVTFLGAWDTLGKIHKVPKRKAKALLKQLRQNRTLGRS